MKVICIKTCKGSLSRHLFFKKGKTYKFREDGSIRGEDGDLVFFHTDVRGKTPLEKWNKYYKIGPHKFYGIFKPVENIFKRF